MSDIIGEKTITKETIVGHTCDTCRKEERDYQVYKDNWFNFSEGHGGWGNDNIDSVNSYDVCSPECFLTKLTERVEWNDGYPDAEIADMPVAFCKRLLELAAPSRSAE